MGIPESVAFSHNNTIDGFPVEEYCLEPCAAGRLACNRSENTRMPTSFELEVGQSILFLRGQRVILDRELAAIYGVETRALNQAIKRNVERFPEDFMFQLNREEVTLSRSQSEILNPGRGRNIKYLPFAFTEHGTIQAANILSSPRAVEMGIYVVRAFVKLRDLLSSNRELARRFAQLETRLNKKLTEHDEAIAAILSAIRQRSRATARSRLTLSDFNANRPAR